MGVKEDLTVKKQLCDPGKGPCVPFLELPE